MRSSVHKVFCGSIEPPVQFWVDVESSLEFCLSRIALRHIGQCGAKQRVKNGLTRIQVERPAIFGDSVFRPAECAEYGPELSAHERVSRLQFCGPFGLGERFIGPMTDKQELAQIEVRGCRFGVELDGLAVFRHRVVELALIPQNVPEAVVRIGKLRIELRRLAKDFEATIASAEAFLYAASAMILLRRLAR
jgi:hypothetical protein